MAERTVVFYVCQDVDKNNPFDRVSAFKGINALTDVQWRVNDDGTDLGVIVARPGTKAASNGRNGQTTRLLFLRIRDDAPFKLDAARTLSPVAVARNENITEFTWMVIWPDSYLAAVSSRDAPSHKKLGYYLGETTKQHTHISNLFRPDLVQRLKEMRQRGLREVVLKVQTSKLSQIEADGQLKGMRNLLNAGRGTDVATLGVDLSVGRSGPDAVLPDDVAADAEQIARHVDAVESLYVKGRDASGRVVTINMKHERIARPVELDLAASNAAIFARIERSRSLVEKNIAPLTKAAVGS